MKTNATELLLVQELFGKYCEQENLSCLKKFTVEKLTGDASIRRYYRVFCDEKSFVVCLDHPLERGLELPFVAKQQFLKTHSVPVPNIYDYNSQKGYILEEDLSDKTLLMKLSEVKNYDEELKLYEKIIDSMVKLHQIPLKDVSSSNLFNEKFDFEKLMSEVDFTIKFFLNHQLAFKNKKVINSIRSEFEKIVEKIAKKKMVLTHRDFHSRNIMLKNEELFIIDFQDARLGLPQYDLVSLLEDCYYDLSEHNRSKLIKRYYDATLETIKDQKSFDEFLEYYHLMAIQRVFKAIGSFAYIKIIRDDIRYLKYIGFAMEKLRKFFMEIDSCQNLKQELFCIYYES